MFTCADMWYEQISAGKMAVKSLAEGAWTYIKGVDFGKGTEKLLVTAKGMGVIELRLDDRNAEPLGSNSQMMDLIKFLWFFPQK